MSWDAVVVVGFHDDHRSFRLFFDLLKRVCQFIDCLCGDAMSAQAAGVRRKIDRNIGSGEAFLAKTIFGSKALTAACAAQTANAGKPMVIQQNDVNSYVLLKSSDDFLRHHEVGTVADQNVTVAAGIGHLYAAGL